MKVYFWLFILFFFCTIFISCKSAENKIFPEKSDIIKAEDFLFSAVADNNNYFTYDKNINFFPDFSFTPEVILIKNNHDLYISKFSENINSLNQVYFKHYPAELEINNNNSNSEYILNKKFIFTDVKNIYSDIDFYNIDVISSNRVFNYKIGQEKLILNIPSDSKESFINNLENNQLEYFNEIDNSYDKKMAVLSLKMLDNSESGISNTADFYRQTEFYGISEHNINWIGNSKIIKRGVRPHK